MATDEVFEFYSDLQKVRMWNDVCIKHNWAQPGELEIWLKSNRVKFSPGGSAIPHLTIGTLSTEEVATRTVMETSPEGFGTLVLQVLTGVVMLGSTKTEEVFWWRIVNRLYAEFSDKFPEQILPKRIRNKIE